MINTKEFKKFALLNERRLQTAGGYCAETDVLCPNCHAVVSVYQAPIMNVITSIRMQNVDREFRCPQCGQTLFMKYEPEIVIEKGNENEKEEQ